MNENEVLVMSGRQLARMSVMVIISVLLIASVYSYGCEIGPVMNEISPHIEREPGWADIDGADFSAIFNTIIFGTQGIIWFAVTMSYCIGMFITAMLLLLPWRLIAIRKKSVIAPQEMKAATTAYISVSVLSLLLGFAGAGFKSLLAVLALTLVVVVIFGLLCYYPYRLAYKRCNEVRNP